ncbi:MAG TPA: helix-turn-helix transcriptional regulator [Egibacteraceae bacterium]|nr:helix-turn-helix transcriptional regulator [Egibacteraceae bacterium]
MSTPGDFRLSDVSYVVLGLLTQEGMPLTPYDLKQRVAESVGYFWSFPTSQLYAETKRLAAAGLLDERVEDTGRRRRFYTPTAAGRRALQAWLADPITRDVELRDEGLLKLYFADAATREDVAALAAAELAKHRRRLAVYETFDGMLTHDERRGVVGATLRRGRYAQEAAVRFWSELAADPPQPTGVPMVTDDPPAEEDPPVR